jgi:hypothetical protein
MQCIQLSTGAKILGIFPFHAKSHSFVASAFLRELASRGHDVTVISHNPQTEKIDNYTDVYVKTTMMDVINKQGKTEISVLVTAVEESCSYFQIWHYVWSRIMNYTWQ